VVEVLIGDWGLPALLLLEEKVVFFISSCFCGAADGATSEIKLNGRVEVIAMTWLTMYEVLLDISWIIYLFVHCGKYYCWK